MKNDFMSNVRESLKERFGKNKTESPKGKFYGDPSKGFIHLCNDENIKKLHAEAEISRPLGIDEVAFAFIAALRVSSWESLGEEFGGYKNGRLWAYILSVLNEKNEESTAATIKIDIPLYEQCPTVPLKEKVFEKCPLKDSEFYGKTVKELMNDLAEKIEHSYDYLNKNKKVKESEEKCCMYCKEKDGTINHDVFIEISDEELGVGWVCKECFLESEKEKDELNYQLQQDIINKDNCFNRIMDVVNEYSAFSCLDNARGSVKTIKKLIKKGLGTEVKK